MPRLPRNTFADFTYHVYNRGIGLAEVFHEPADYAALINLIASSSEQIPMRVLGYCLMPDHYHMVLQPYEDRDLSRWVHRLMTGYLRYYRQKHGVVGNLWNARFKSFPCQHDRHLGTVIRYCETNPIRAGLVERAEKWKYGSLYATANQKGPVAIEPGPIRRGKAWVELANEPMKERDLGLMRHSLRRGTPFGDSEWMIQTARIHGTEATLKPIGRPRKSEI
jgi:putative transposase